MTKVRWLRIAYWVGIVMDAVVALGMLFPEALGMKLWKLGFTATPEVRYAFWFGAPLMIGWTVLLFWADRKPVERKGVLLITLLPVVAGYTILLVLMVILGQAALAEMWSTLVVQAGLITLLSYSYVNARDLPPVNRPAAPSTSRSAAS